MTSKFKREFIIYSLSVGIDRGSMLLYLPLLSSILGVEGYGNYNYTIVLTRFLIPIICLNIFVGIIKTGAENIKRGLYLCRVASVATFIVTSLVAAVAYFLINDVVHLIYFYVIALAGCEALQSIVLSYLRAAEKNISYLLFVVIKVCVFIVVLYVLKSNVDLSLYRILNIQFFITFCLFLFYFLTSKGAIERFSIKSIVIFSLYLIPHGIAQWGMVACKNIFLKTFSNDLMLGYFSILFTVGSVVLLINSGIGIVLPQHMIQNYEKWKDAALVRNFFLQYSGIVFLLFITILIGLLLDKNHFSFFDIYDKGILLNFVFIYAGFYILGFYYYYSNVLFCLGKSQVIMWITVITSIISISISAILIFLFELPGAAISIVVSYLIYSLLSAFISSRHEKSVVKTFYPALKIMLSTCILFFISFFTFSYAFSL